MTRVNKDNLSANDSIELREELKQSIMRKKKI